MTAKNKSAKSSRPQKESKNKGKHPVAFMVDKETLDLIDERSKINMRTRKNMMETYVVPALKDLLPEGK